MRMRRYLVQIHATSAAGETFLLPTISLTTLQHIVVSVIFLLLHKDEKMR